MFPQIVVVAEQTPSVCLLRSVLKPSAVIPAVLEEAGESELHSVGQCLMVGVDYRGSDGQLIGLQLCLHLFVFICVHTHLGPNVAIQHGRKASCDQELLTLRWIQV